MSGCYDIGLPGVYGADAAWGDVDADGDPETLLRLNEPMIVNDAPEAPSNLSVEQNGDTAILSWDTGEDEETPQALLTYNVRMGTSSEAATWCRH